MDAGTAHHFGLGAIDQVSYVVTDMAESLPRYEALFGPFKIGETPLPDCTVRRVQADVKLKIAVNSSGPLEIELIQVLEGQTTHSEHLKKHGEGLHHVRFRVAQIDAKLKELESAGFEKIFFKRFGPTIAFAYLESPAEMGKSVIELLECPEE